MPTNGEIQIRPAVAADASLILGFIQDLADYERLSHEVVATVQDLETHLFGEQPAAEVLIAEFEGEPAGFALFFANFSTFLGLPGIYLEDLFVRPDYRALGIGKTLLTHIAGLVVERGWDRLDWSVLDWNEPSINFYRNLGAVPMKDWVRFRLAGDALAALGSKQPA